MTFSESMDELARTAGIGPVATDEEGGVTLLFDGEHEVTFSPAPDGGILFLCEVGDADRLGEGACRALLEASFSGTGGAAFAIRRDLGKVVLWTRHGPFASSAGLERAVNDFLGHAIAWKKRLADGDLVAAADATPNAPFLSPDIQMI